MCSLPSHSIQAGEERRCAVRSTGGPPKAETIQTSPPVEPWSLINPPMNAIAFPSGDHLGTAICNPCSGPETSAGARMALGASSPPSDCLYNLATHQLFSPGGAAAT